MGKIAFVFAGQGAQYEGMGKDLYENVSAAKELFDVLSTVKEDIIPLTFDSDKDTLSQTINTQPALFAFDLAAALALKNAGITADGVAGFSLGEIPALSFCGALSNIDGFKLVIERAKLMDKASKEKTGKMTAVLKLESSEIKKVADKFSEVYPVNYNCQTQTVVASGEKEFDDFKNAIKEIGGKTIDLAVSGAFHSPFMESAAYGLEKTISALDFKNPIIPIYSNYTALPHNENIKNDVVCQVKNPVLWQKTIENMIRDGFDTFVEVGAGKTLSGLIKKIDKDVKTYSVSDTETLNFVVNELKEK